MDSLDLDGVFLGIFKDFPPPFESKPQIRKESEPGKSEQSQRNLYLGTNPAIPRSQRPGFHHHGQIPAEFFAKIPEDLRSKRTKVAAGP